MELGKVYMTNQEALDLLYKNSKNTKEIDEAYRTLSEALVIIESKEREIKPCTEEYRRVYMQGWNEGRRKLVAAMEKEISV